MWNSTDVHHAARMGWGVGGRAKRGKAGRGEACKVVLSVGLKVQHTEEKLEERRGAAGPGLIARSVDRRSLERGEATHGKVTAWAITHKAVCRGAECGRGYQEREASKKRMEGSERETRVSCSSDRSS